ncbi:hypothetical protein JQC67_05085 [Aurantibacter crassamenti]|uniref:hypothetical protein n=1 Tax=Aurantibacter crassamenti TaxID=1837375 RepID=UPI00193A0059|nr:hypothetical protein [Aurantibacter crassamenti]MBM1105511.1 hypothetical protein [Aurantibacter crassamenti]
MKVLAYAFCFFSLAFISLSLSELRKNYVLANDNKEVTQKMHDALASISEDDQAILVAYKGAVSTLLAKHSKAIKDKKGYFKEGVVLLETAIKEEPNNIEIRCLRLGVQENSPKILRYKSEIPTDKQFILDHYSSETSQEIKDFVKGYIQQSNSFTQAEKQLF